jgi:hypothetical protein
MQIDATTLRPPEEVWAKEATISHHEDEVGGRLNGLKGAPR